MFQQDLVDEVGWGSQRHESGEVSQSLHRRHYSTAYQLWQ
jgi:hypothetical protein